MALSDHLDLIFKTLGNYVKVRARSPAFIEDELPHFVEPRIDLGESDIDLVESRIDLGESGIDLVEPRIGLSESGIDLVESSVDIVKSFF